MQGLPFSIWRPGKFKLSDFAPAYQEQIYTKGIYNCRTFNLTGGYIMRKKKFSRALTFSLDPKDFDEIQRLTDEQEISLAEFCRKALSVALTTNQPKEEPMND